MRGKNENGEFQSPFNPFKWGDAFTEGNSWHYSWSVFHDVQGLVDLMGGKDKFVKKLDSVFSMPPIFDESVYGGVIHEIREMQIADMGQYAHGNQPIQHMIYLYNYSGQPWKSQAKAREVMENMYSSTENGYPGDEDQGQTSSWYVLSAMGFYSVCPGTNEYVLGSPVFEKMTISLENGNKFIIKADGNNKSNVYIDEVFLNGEEYTKDYITYQDIMKGGEFNLKMSAEPNKQRGIEEKDEPFSLTRK